jgi:ferrous iron transport protein A
MANQASFFIPLAPTTHDVASGAHARRDSQPNLAAVELRTPVRIVALAVDAETRAWLRAVGISEGERVVPLRRAVFGGPIHVRTGSGGEFALHRGLAKAILVANAVGEDSDGESESAA